MMPTQGAAARQSKRDHMAHGSTDAGLGSAAIIRFSKA
jgi:hypothetical protein